MNLPFFIKRYTSNFDNIKYDVNLLKTYSIPKMIKFYGCLQTDEYLYCIYDYK